MRLAPFGAVVFACALAWGGSIANAKPRSDSQGASHCVFTNAGRVLCPASANRTMSRARVTAGHVEKAASAAPTISRSCLTAETRAILEQAEAHFGVTFRLVSTCRPGAVIAGTNHPSEHRYGKAVDLLPPAGMKAAVVKWLYAHAPGVTMVYARMPHVHFDTGPYHALACGGCARSKPTRVAHVQ